MKSALHTDIVRSIRGSLGRFFAIMGIAALGCGFYAGLRMCGPDMRAAADALYDGTNLWDLRLVSTLGFGDDDVARVGQVAGVRRVMGQVTTDAMGRMGEVQEAMRVSTLDGRMAASGTPAGRYAIDSPEDGYLNRVLLVEGRWPEGSGECVVSADVPHVKAGVGETVTLLYGTTDLDELFSTRTFEVVGTVTASNYPYTGSFGSTSLGSGMISQYVYVSPSSLADDAPYTEIYLTVDGAADELSESDAYQAVVDRVRDRLEGLELTIACARLDDLRAKAQSTLDDHRAAYESEKAAAEAELAEAKAELDDGAAQIAQGEDELAKGECDYQNGAAELGAQRDAAYATLADAASRISAGQRELDDRQRQLERARRELADGRGAYERGLRELLAQMGTTSLADARRSLSDAARQADEGATQLEAAIAQIESGPALARAGIEEAQAGIAQAQAAIDQADAGIAQASAAIEDLETQREELEGAAARLEARRAELEGALETASPEEQGALESELAAVEASLSQTREGLAAVDEALSQARAQLDQASAGKDQAQGALSQAQAGLAQAQAALEEAERAQGQLPALRAQLETVLQARAQAQEALGGVDQLEGSKAQLDAAQGQLDDGTAQLAEGAAQLQAARRDLAEGAADAERQLAEGQGQLDDARAQLDEARAQLGDAKARYAEGLARYEQGREEADERLADAQAQLLDAQRKIDEMERPDVYLLDRTQSEGAATYHADTLRMDSIGKVFPFIFFLVAALVSLTTMTRMVEDDRVLIGTYKALGYSRAAIASKYLVYAGLAATVGATLGIVALSQVLPYIVMSAYSIIYTIPVQTPPLPIDPGIALASGGMGVGVTLAATWGAVVSSLREVPAALMLPRAPKAGKRILLERAGPLWSHLSFTWKVTCRNIFRYKRRLLMTVIGISGCTALLLVGFGLHDSIWDIIDRQYGPIIHFDTTVSLDADSTSVDVERVHDYLRGTGDVTRIVRVQNENMQARGQAAGSTTRVNVVIPRDVADIAGAVTFRNRSTGEDLAFDGDAVLVTEKLAMIYDLDVGSQILLFDQDEIGNAVGDGHALTVTGITENYVGNLVYVGRSAWKAIDGRALPFSTLYATTTDDEGVRRGIADELHGMRGVSTVIFSDEVIDMYRSMLSVVDMIVVVLIVSAAALAYIVLYNLTNINVAERVREIASLKVLGFTKREVYSYIFREIALLAVIGDALGLVLGIFLERFVVTTAEVDYVMFGRSIHPQSFAYAFGLTMAFTALVLLTMRRRLDRVDMVESLKSVD